MKSDAAHRLKEIRGDALELEVTFQSPAAKEFGLDVLCDSSGENGLRVAVMPESKTLTVGSVHAPFELKTGEDLALRVFIDKNLVEVFANDRQAAVACLQVRSGEPGDQSFQQGGRCSREGNHRLEDEIDLCGPVSCRYGRGANSNIPRRRADFQKPRTDSCNVACLG